MAQTLYLPIQQVFTDLGLIGAGFKLETFKTGTSTPLATYSDTALTIANANPTIADSAGRFPQIFINDAKLYKAVLKDAEDNVVWTADPIDPKIFTLNDFDPRPTSFWGVTDGTSTVYTLAANPAITAYSSNQTFFLQFHIACGIAPTIAISELSALALKKSDGAGGKVDLEINDVLTGTYEARNDGTDIVILNPEKPFFDSRNLIGADAGKVISYAANTPPTGYLECNGSAISRTTYSTLFAIVNTTWGVGDGSTTFNIPDLRGEFVRGWDNGKGTDSGRTFASSQIDNFQAHRHEIVLGGDGNANSTSAQRTVNDLNTGTTRSGVYKVDGANGTPRFGSETRPRNIALMYCIKY